MLNKTECADCADSGEICTGCWAPTDWCDCEQGEVAAPVIACKTCCDEKFDVPLVEAA